jgi:hypothetical protein
MAVADADNRRRAFFLARLTPPVTRTRKRFAEFLLQHFLDKSAHTSADPVLNRVEPIVEKQTLGGDSRLLRGILRHGVVSVPAR